MSEFKDLDESEPSDQELVEAAALATALERGHAQDGLDEESLAAAALLRYSHDGGELDPERAEALLADVLRESSIEPAGERERPSSFARLLKWLAIPALGVSTLAAAAIFVAVLSESAPVEPPTPTAGLPTASPALLREQIDSFGDAAASRRALAAHRRATFAALAAHYGGG